MRKGTKSENKENKGQKKKLDFLGTKQLRGRKQNFLPINRWLYTNKKGGILGETITKEKLLEIIKRKRKKPHIFFHPLPHTPTPLKHKKKPLIALSLFFFLERPAAAHRLKKNNLDQQPSPSFPKHSVKKKPKIKDMSCPP